MVFDPSKTYKVCLVVLNYNSPEYTIDCIKSIKEFTDKNLKYSIVVVDNNSEPEKYNYLLDGCKDFGEVKIVRTNINIGFSGGNMFGVQHANADYLFFLNNDTVFLNDCLSILSDFMMNHKNVGICTGQMYNADMTAHHSFSYFPTLSLKLLGSSLHRVFNPEKYPKRKNEYTDPLKVDLVTGAAMFVDNSKFSQIGGFDTNFFLYSEEEDIAMRLNKAGYSAYVVPAAKFIHFGGKSTKRNIDFLKEYYISVLYYHRKHSNLIGYVLFKGFYFFKTFKKFYKHFDYVKLAFFILRGAGMKYSMKHKQKIRSDNP